MILLAGDILTGIMFLLDEGSKGGLAHDFPHDPQALDGHLEVMFVGDVVGVDCRRTIGLVVA